MLNKISIKHAVIAIIIAVVLGTAGIIFSFLHYGNDGDVNNGSRLGASGDLNNGNGRTEFNIDDIVAPSRGVNQLVFSNPYDLPETPRGGNILHAWNMSFNEIVEHLPYIAEAGFGVIQTSPIGASLIREDNAGAFGRWYDLYQPTQFRIGNYLGTEDDFRNLTSKAAEYGIFIIVDALPNHTTAYWDKIDPALRDFEPSLFHSRQGENVRTNIWIAPMDFGDRRSFVRCNLLGLWDFNTGSEEFQEIYMAFLGTKIEAGASGFRYDALHHIELPNDPPDIASDFWPIVSKYVDEKVHSLGRIPFQYGETLGGGYRANHYLQALYEHANVMVTPYAFSRSILTTVSLGFLRDGQDGWNTTNFHIFGSPHSHDAGRFGPAFTAVDLGDLQGFAEGVVPWVESHDQYGNDGMSQGLTNEQLIAGWALISARQGTSPLFFVRPGSGFQNDGNMFIPQDDGTFTNRWGHDLLYRDPAIAAINRFSNDFIAFPELTSTHGNVAIIQRGEPGNKTGAVLVNVGKTGAETLYPVSMANGSYRCAISGSLYSVENGWLIGDDIGAESVIVLRFISNEQPAGQEPRIGIYSPDNSGFFHEHAGTSLSLIVRHTVSQTVKVLKNGEMIKETPFINGDSITVGADSDIGDIFTVTIVAVSPGGDTHELSRTYEKREEPEPDLLRVEYVRNENRWDKAGIWAWNAAGDVFPMGWPGPEMEWAERLDGEGYAWVFYLPEDTLLPVTLIFNNFGGGQQTVPYLTIMQSTRVFQIGSGVDIGDAEPIYP